MSKETKCRVESDYEAIVRRTKELVAPPIVGEDFDPNAYAEMAGEVLL